MLRYGISTLALLAVLAISPNAQAGALSLLTPNDGAPDFLEDDDFESLVNTDGSVDGLGNKTVTGGDLFVGIFRVNFINDTNAALAGSSFTGVLVAAVDKVVGTTVTFRAATAGEYTALTGGTNPGLGGVLLSNLPARFSADTALLVYDDSDAATNFINPNGVGTGFTGANDAIPTATNGTKLFEFGFVGDASASATLGGGSLGILSFKLGLNLTQNLTSLQLADVAVVSGLNPTHIQVNGEVDGVPPISGDFELRTDANLFVNPIPEPASLTLFGLGALGLLGARLRRRNAA